MSKKDKGKNKDHYAISKPIMQKGGRIKTAGFPFFSNDKFKVQVSKLRKTRAQSILAIIAVLIILLGGFSYKYPY